MVCGWNKSWLQAFFFVLPLELAFRYNGDLWNEIRLLFWILEASTHT